MLAAACCIQVGTDMAREGASRAGGNTPNTGTENRQQQHKLTGNFWVLASSEVSFAESELSAIAATNAVVKSATATAATTAAPPPCLPLGGEAPPPTDPSANHTQNQGNNARNKE